MFGPVIIPRAISHSKLDSNTFAQSEADRISRAEGRVIAAPQNINPQLAGVFSLGQKRKSKCKCC